MGILTTMPTARWGAASAVYNNNIYVVGGAGATTSSGTADYQSTFEIYDTS